MIEFEHLDYWGFSHAMRGMRNPLESWHKNDTVEEYDWIDKNHIRKVVKIGPNDLELAKRLAKGGTEHRKYVRQIFVSVDITAPIYWWKEYDTYKIGTTANSTSTMHKLMSRPLRVDDFSLNGTEPTYFDVLSTFINRLNSWIEFYRNTDDSLLKEAYWRGVIQLLPMSYNQTRTVTLNYEVVANMVSQRKHHKLSEWLTFCDYMIESLPYFKEIFADTEVLA